MGKIALCLVLLVLAGCTSKFNRFTDSITDRPAKVVCYSGGKVIYEGTSTGKPKSEETSDGYYFTDTDGDSIEVSGDCVFTYVEDK